MHHTEAEERELLALSGMTDALGHDNLEMLKRRYNEAGRYYHTWDHALEVLAATMQMQLNEYARYQHGLAALWHDVVYEIGVKGCEEQSAEAMVEFCQVKKTDLAYGLVMITATHGTSTAENTPLHMQNFLDCDILGIAEPSWPLMVVRDWNVGAEIVPKYGLKLSTAGRKDFLQKWLDKPSIFVGQRFSSHEWQARQNIHRLINHDHNFDALNPAP